MFPTKASNSSIVAFWRRVEPAVGTPRSVVSWAEPDHPIALDDGGIQGEAAGHRVEQFADRAWSVDHVPEPLLRNPKA